MHQPGRHFLQIPGPTNTPLPVLAAIAKPTIDHRGPAFGELGRGARRRAHGVQDHEARDHLSGVRNRRLGSGARQHPVARRQGPDVRNGMVLDPVEDDGRPSRHRGGVHQRRLALGRRCRRPSSPGCRRTSRTRSRPSRSCTTKRRPAWHPTLPPFVGRSTTPTTPPYSSSTRSPRSARSTTGTRSGGSTSPSGGPRRD